MGESPAPGPVGQFSASVPAKAERTNTWQWADHTTSDVSFPPSACFLSELLPPFPRGCWEVGARDVALQPWSCRLPAKAWGGETGPQEHRGRMTTQGHPIGKWGSWGSPVLCLSCSGWAGLSEGSPLTSVLAIEPPTSPRRSG